MIVKLTMLSVDPPRCLITDGKGFSYEGGLNQDMIDDLKGRTVAYYEASLGPEGIEIGDEVEEGTWCAPV